MGMNMKRVTITAVLLVLLTCPLVCLGQEDAGTVVNGITVSGLSMNYSEDQDGRMITTFGTFKNSSDVDVDEIFVEIKYFDSGKNLVDVVTRPIYGLVVPAGQEVSFRVRDEADKKKEAYASSTARVISAEPKTRVQERKKESSSSWIELFLGWFPMLFLIAIWIFFVRRYSGKSSPQQRTLALVEKQNDILSRQVEMLERIASAMENNKDKHQKT